MEETPKNARPGHSVPGDATVQGFLCGFLRGDPL